MAQDVTAPAPDGNALVNLAIAVIHAILYVLHRIRDLVGWATITFPG